MQKENQDPDGLFTGSVQGVDEKGQGYIEFRLAEQMFRDIKEGRYRHLVDRIRRCYYNGEYKEAHRLERLLPIMYPGAHPGVEGEEEIYVNGLVVVSMRYMNVHDAAEALTHLQKWPFVKGYFHNVCGSILVLIWVGLDFHDEDDFKAERERVVNVMNQALPKVHFTFRKRSVRGFMASYDPQAFCRPDRCVQTLTQF